MNTDERDRIERACERLIIAYARYADTCDDENFAALFTDDGRLHRGTDTVVGREAIRAAMGTRRRDSVVRHLCSNILVDVIDADTASAVSAMTLYRSFGSGEMPAALPPVEMIVDYHDRFRRTADGWRIADRRTVIVYRSK